MSSPIHLVEHATTTEHEQVTVFTDDGRDVVGDGEVSELCIGFIGCDDPLYTAEFTTEGDELIGHGGVDGDAALERLEGGGLLTGLPQATTELTFFTTFSASLLLCPPLLGQSTAIEHENRTNGMREEETDAGHTKLKVTISGEVESKLSCTRITTTMEPRVGVDTNTMMGVSGDVHRVSDGLEQREETLDAHDEEGEGGEDGGERGEKG